MSYFAERQLFRVAAHVIAENEPNAECNLCVERRKHVVGFRRLAIIVFACLAALAGLVYVAAPRDGCVGIANRADTDARVIRSAVSQWQLAENKYNHCPTVFDLIRDHQLDGGQSVLDPWENDYRILCTGDDVIVTSAGDDERFGTRDDISADPPLRRQ